MRQIINATRIDQFFQSASRDAQELLPHLVRNLIAATTNADELRVPVGDAIGRPGYDGVVQVTEGSRYVPQHRSVWEMGTGDPAAKAEADYRNRTDHPGGLNLGETSFVFVAPHRWDSKDAWAQRKREERRWRDVRCLDNVDLEAWLEGAPSVARWLARQVMPEVIGGVEDFELFWREQRLAGSIQPKAELIIGGRADASAKVTQWLSGDDREIVVQGEDVMEAAAFVAAVVMSLPDAERERIALRMLFVDHRDALDYLGTLMSPHIVVALTPEVYKRAQAMNVSHLRIVFAKVRSSGGGSEIRSTVRLGTVARAAVAKALLSMNIPEQRAGRISIECKGSLTAILWMLAGVPDSPLPWTEHTGGAELLPIVLAGQWAGDNPHDRDAVGKLCGRDYQAVESTLHKWPSPKGPIIRRGEVWDWLAWDFAWGHLAALIDHGMAQRFRQVAMEVLGEPDPRYELTADERWAAPLHGKVHPYSPYLRSGLVASIVQFSLHDAYISGGLGNAMARGLVRDLLSGITVPRRSAWLSLAPWLPDLAEAAPDEFLCALDAAMQDRVAMMALFEEGGVFPSSTHTYVLWALERLAWSPERFSRAVLALTDLAGIDPGGRLNNRPLDSLVRIFLPWLPQTSASTADRLHACDLINRRSPDVAWKLTTSLLPQSYSVTHGTAEPQWHDWKPSGDARPTVQEFWDFVEPMVDRLLNWAGRSSERWAVFIGAWNDLRLAHTALGERVLTVLLALDPEPWPDCERCLLAKALRDLMRRHRDFSDKEWAMSASEMARFEQLHDRMQPRGTVERHSWLFGAWPELPTGRAANYQTNDRQVAEARLNALREIHGQQGLEGVYRLAEAAVSPWAVGVTLEQLGLADADEHAVLKHTITLEPLAGGKPPLLFVGMGYMAEVYQRQGFDGIDRLVGQHNDLWTETAYANLAMALPKCGPTWDRLESWGADAVRLYWSRIVIHLLGDPKRDGQRAVTQLLQAERYYSAVYVCAGCLHGAGPEATDAYPVSVDLVVRCLNEAPGHDPADEADPPALNSLGYHVAELLDLLEVAGTALPVLAGLEWTWMPALENTQRNLKALQTALSEDPQWYVDALKLAFRAEGEVPRELATSEVHRATQAHRLLRAWHRVPGTIRQSPPKASFPGDVPFADGEIDGTELRKWFDRASCLASECGQLDMFHLQFGQVLAHAPLSSDGNWPCAPIAELIESERNGRLERGIGIGVYNKWGAHFRQRGGGQERAIRDKFRRFAEAAAQWPRTQALLRQIADRFDAEARREDEREAFDEFEQ